MNKAEMIVHLANGLRDRVLANEKLMAMLENLVRGNPIKEFLLDTFRGEGFSQVSKVLVLAKEYLWKHRVELTKALDTNNPKELDHVPYLRDALATFSAKDREEIFKAARKLTDLITGIAHIEGW